MSANSKTKIDEKVSVIATETGLPAKIVQDVISGNAVPDSDISALLREADSSIDIPMSVIEPRSEVEEKLKLTPVASLKGGYKILSHDNTMLTVVDVVKSRMKYKVVTENGPLFIENGGTLVIASKGKSSTEAHDLASRFT